jgi:hypothetical protein
MQAATDAQTAWLKNQVAQIPKGTNTIIVTHFPNINRAFPELSTGLADGEALVFGPGSTFVARIKIEDWPTLK